MHIVAPSTRESAPFNISFIDSVSKSQLVKKQKTSGEKSAATLSPTKRQALASMKTSFEDHPSTEEKIAKRSGFMEVGSSSASSTSQEMDTSEVSQTSASKPRVTSSTETGSVAPQHGSPHAPSDQAIAGSGMLRECCRPIIS